MVSDGYDAQAAPPGVMAGSWQAMLFLAARDASNVFNSSPR
jgi:hypothetical protein